MCMEINDAPSVQSKDQRKLQSLKQIKEIQQQLIVSLTELLFDILQSSLQ